jgi:hypothetical protein
LLHTALQRMNTPEHQNVGALLHDRIIGALELCCRRGVQPTVLAAVERGGVMAERRKWRYFDWIRHHSTRACQRSAAAGSAVTLRAYPLTHFHPSTLPMIGKMARCGGARVAPDT